MANGVMKSTTAPRLVLVTPTIPGWTLNTRKFGFSLLGLARRYHRRPRLTGGEVFTKFNRSQLAAGVSANTRFGESCAQADEVDEGSLVTSRAEEVVYKNVGAFDINFVVIEPRVRLQLSNQSVRHRCGSVGNDIDFAKLRSGLVEQSLDVRFRGDVPSHSEDFGGAADGLDCSGRFFEQRGLATGKNDSLRAGLGPGSGDLLKDPLGADLHMLKNIPRQDHLMRP